MGLESAAKPRPKFRDNLTTCSLRQLEELTGKGHRKVKQALASLPPAHEDGNAKYYNSPEALECIYRFELLDELGADEGAGARERLDPAKERALLDSARRRKVEIETQILEKSVAPIEIFKLAMQDLATAARSRLLGIESKLGPRLVGQKDIKIVRKILSEEINEILLDLSKTDPKEIASLIDGGDADDVAEE